MARQESLFPWFLWFAHRGIIARRRRRCCISLRMLVIITLFAASIGETGQLAKTGDLNLIAQFMVGSMCTTDHA
ncbi:Protein of unknown function [Pyronema omphalodes CBS 100304]|uniref:Uncharacterized protein n=1 Tax=Pyronema omphalodes (strain CBS 100304) TaxID=1076935 RepID=U4LFF9_PYROM|nr:Protein of unknown function [Pyronema omphalodes CBS 100304]